MNRRFVVNKIIRYATTFLLVLVLCFLIPRLMPGDPVQNLLGWDYDALPREKVDQMYRDFGLDRSLPEQFLLYVKSVLTMNLGYSFTYGSRVTDLISQAILPSMLILLPALAIGSVTALVAGVRHGMRKGSMGGRITLSMVTLVFGLPTFIVGMLFILVFSYHFKLFPFGHMTSIGRSFEISNIADIIWHLALPVSVISIMVFASYYLVMRNSTEQISNEYFIRVERAHGYPENLIRDRHVSKNVRPQFVSMIALSISGLVSGSLVTEIVFSINGMGMLLYKAVNTSDYLLMQGIFLMIIIFTLLCNFATEIIYGYIDPRIRMEGER